MVEVNGAYKTGRYKNIRLNSLSAKSNVKAFAMQDRWLAEHDPVYTDPYDTHYTMAVLSEFGNDLPINRKQRLFCLIQVIKTQ